MKRLQLDAAAALVLFSGGQDSATCLAWALSRFERVETVGFHYGQVHAVEMNQRGKLREGIAGLRPEWHTRLGADHEFDLGVLGQISRSSLTGAAEPHFADTGLPPTFVPGRNLLFLTAAAALGYRVGTKQIITGVCETDYSGYPDCRDDTIKALQVAINLGTEAAFTLHTPLMWIDKAQTWAMAQELGGSGLIDIIRRDSHTCYRGDRSKLHDWGYGCGSCPACELRSHGWLRFSRAVGAA